MPTNSNKIGKSGTSEGGEPNTFYFPTEQACDAFGIKRRGAKPRGKQEPKNQSKEETNIASTQHFLSGPQFVGLSATNGKEINKNPNTLNITKPEQFLNESANASSDGGAQNGLVRNSIDEVILEFLGNTPYSTVTRSDGDIVRVSYERSAGGAEAEPISIVRIAPNSQDWLELGVDHTWEKPGSVLTQIFDTVTEGVGLVNDAVQIYNGFASNFEGGEDDAARRYMSNRDFRFDQSDQYTDTSIPEITIPFTLFTPGGGINNFIRDIYIPIILMKAWSSPKRSTEPIRLDRPEDNNPIANDGGGEATPESDELSSAEDPPPESTVVQEDTLARAGKFFPGFRFAVLDPPSYIRLTHSSGLFRFPNCAITSFKYSYKGPWVHTTQEEQKMPEMAAIKNLGLMTERAYPTIAECTLTLKVLDKMYADDWLAMFDTEMSSFLNGANSSTVEVLRRTPSRDSTTTTPDSNSTVGN